MSGAEAVLAATSDQPLAHGQGARGVQRFLDQALASSWERRPGPQLLLPPPGVGSGPDRDAVDASEALAAAAGILKPAQDGAQAVYEVGQQHEASGGEDLSQQVHGAVSQPCVTGQTASETQALAGENLKGVASC